MPRRELVWTHGAIEQFAELLKRRLVAANDLENVAKRWDGPMEDVWLYRFRCDDLRDGKTIALYLQAELEPRNGTVGLLGCGTIPL